MPSIRWWAATLSSLFPWGCTGGEIFKLSPRVAPKIRNPAAWDTRTPRALLPALVI